MAINLWKLAGRPTSYNPLPNSNFLDGIIGGDLVIRFKAKSISGTSQIRVYNAPFNYLVTPTTEIKSYEVIIPSVPGRLHFYDYSSKGDIIIQDIELVQKPLPKLTINGIDGFLSGKWNIHANARVIDDETLELNATGIGQISILELSLVVGQTYTISCETGAKFAIYRFANGSNGASYSGYNSAKPATFVADQVGARFYLSNDALGVGKFTFKRPMLNLGSIPAPYSKKTGDKMVMPVPKKNLFDGAFPNVGYYTNATGGLTPQVDRKTSGFIPVKPNTDYTIKIQENGYGLDRINFYSSNNEPSFLQTNASNSAQTFSFKTTPSTGFIRFTARTIDSVLVQLEEGTIATPYAPYAVQMNPKPKKYVPKKNLFDVESVFNNAYGSNYSITKRDGRDCIKLAAHGGVNGKILFDQFKPNTQYSLGYEVYHDSAPNGLALLCNYTDGTFNYVNSGTSYQWDFVTFLSTPGKSVKNITMTYGTGATPTYITRNTFQLEEGTQRTPYEPYQQVLPRAKTGLSFNGVTDYLQLPSMTMDAIEIDCLIDSVQNNPNNYLLDLRSVLGDPTDRIYYGSGGSSFTANGIFLGMPPIPKGERVKTKLNFGTQKTVSPKLFASYDGTNRGKGTLYKVTCYLNGSIVAQYDFENPNNIVGDKVMPNAKNLIPSFEDSRWNLHPNFKVLGKDVGRLDATIGGQNSDFYIDVNPNTKYLFGCTANGLVVIRTPDNAVQYYYQNGGYSVFATDSKTTRIYIRLSNGTSATGTFDFIRPQLYALSGKEGTLFGKPVMRLKAPKRTLYNKR